MVFPITYDISNNVCILYLFDKVYTPRGSPQLTARRYWCHGALGWDGQNVACWRWAKTELGFSIKNGYISSPACLPKAWQIEYQHICEIECQIECQMEFLNIYIYMPDRLSADHPKKILRVSVRNHQKSFLFVGKCWICWRQTNIVRKNNQSIKISTAWMLFKTGFFHCQLPCWMTVGANMLRTNDFVSFIST